MPPPRTFNKDKRPKRNKQSLLFRRKRFCRFTVAKVEHIDYKDVDTLRDFVGENGKIIAGPPDRHARVLPAPADHRHQARALPRAAAVQRPTHALRSTDHANHPAGKGRQPRQPGRRRQGQGRLRPQLPDPAPAARAAPPRRTRNSKPSAPSSKRPPPRSWPPRKRSARSWPARPSASRRRPASTAACSARSPTPTSPKR